MKNTIITENEKLAAKRCIDFALEAGADAVRISLCKNILNIINVLDGKLDKTSCNMDRQMFLNIFAEGRYGTFSTNRLDEMELRGFLAEAVAMTRALAPDPARTMPPKEAKATGCTSGDEMEISDEKFFTLSQDDLVGLALKYSGGHDPDVLSAESELSTTLYNDYMVDSDGFEGLNIETTFSMYEEVTVEDGNGDKYSGYWSESSSFLKDWKIEDVYGTAVSKARESMGPKRIQGGKFTVIVDRRCANRLVTPLLDALDGLGVQQQNSFLAGMLGKKAFPEHLNIVDNASEKGARGSRAYDSEGMTSIRLPLITDGVVSNYYVNTFIANKTGLPLTTGHTTRPAVLPFMEGADICKSCKNKITLKDIFKRFPKAIYITAFNGGNCNGATGNYSFGIEGLLMENGVAVHPVREILMTGNMLELWNSVAAAADDASKGTTWQIPSLVFENVEING